MSFKFRIVTGAPTPIYRQLVDQATLAFASRQIVPGERMPSVRSVAEEILVNPNTVARAYSDLVRNGVLETQPGRGIFVAERRQRLSKHERERRLDWAVQQFINEVALLDFDYSEIAERVVGGLKELDRDQPTDHLGAKPLNGEMLEQGDSDD